MSGFVNLLVMADEDRIYKKPIELKGSAREQEKQRLKYLNSWMDAIEHQWDGIWEFGEKIKRWQLRADYLFIVLLILAVFALITWMVKPFIP